MNRTIYIAHKDEDELAHYGVRGMKWGVRKEIGNDAKAAAIARSRATSLQKQAVKLSSRIDKLKASGKTANRSLSSRAKSVKKEASKYQEIEKVLSKGLSEKDIKQGRRAVKLKSVLRFALIGPMGRAGSEVTDDGYIDLQLKKRKSK
jgi:hypothetical protein